MKKSLKLSLILLLGVASLQSCKKGENDPALSLKSRDSRITGTWVLKSSDYKRTVTATSGSVSVTDVKTIVFDGTLRTVINNGNTNADPYTSELEIDKKGTFKSTVVDNGDSSESNGYWWWLNSKKNKTRIAFDDDFDSYDIDRLTNKEMIVTQNYSSKNVMSNGDIDETVITSTYTYEKKK